MMNQRLNLYQFELHRNTLELETPPYKADIDSVANLSSNGDHYWFSEYAHRIGDPNEVYVHVGIDDFRDYMQHLENSYGRDGSDRIWVAPVQEVYEYLVVRENTVLISSKLSNNTLTVKYDLSMVPLNLRRYALSLLVNLPEGIKVKHVEADNVNACFNQNGLINLSW